MNAFRLALIHWFPVEYYPPVMNMMNCFGSHPELHVRCFTSHNTRSREPYTNSHCRITRYRFPQTGQNPVVRLWNYLWFPLSVFLRLIWFRPDAILYIEPQSAMPVVLYSLVFRRCRIFIHNHEYHDPHQFLRPGMRLVRIYHWLEKKFIFPRAEWISETNQDRIRMFREDFPQLSADQFHELPNLPPRSWLDQENIAWRDRQAPPLKLVYVGSLSLRDTFIEELVQWMQTDAAASCELDVYCYNHGDDVRELFDGCHSPRVRFHSNGIPYEELPNVLTEFHVGLILYKATTRNYVYNASNKLFEYLALGLDVWYPQQMLGVKPYARQDHTPRIVELDFEQLQQLDVEPLQSRDGLQPDAIAGCCETALEELITRLLQGRSAADAREPQPSPES